MLYRRRLTADDRLAILEREPGMTAEALGQLLERSPTTIRNIARVGKRPFAPPGGKRLPRPFLAAEIDLIRESIALGLSSAEATAKINEKFKTGRIASSVRAGARSRGLQFKREKPARPPDAPRQPSFKPHRPSPFWLKYGPRVLALYQEGEGVTMSDIADTLSTECGRKITKNAVIGWYHRAGHSMPAGEEPLSQQERLRFDLVEALEDGGCAYPYSDPGKPDFHFCGAARHRARSNRRQWRSFYTYPYCFAHCQISYVNFDGQDPEGEKAAEAAIDAEALRSLRRMPAEERAKDPVYGAR